MPAPGRTASWCACGAPPAGRVGDARRSTATAGLARRLSVTGASSHSDGQVGFAPGARPPAPHRGKRLHRVGTHRATPPPPHRDVGGSFGRRLLRGLRPLDGRPRPHRGSLLQRDPRERAHAGLHLPDPHAVATHTSTRTGDPMSKNKGGREVRKPKQDKKVKTAEAETFIRKTEPAK